jgi:electron transfer flavoprotein alpha subunit
MSIDSWLLVTSNGWGGALALAREVGSVTVMVVGTRQLADQVAAAGPDDVRWVESPAGTPAEAYADGVAGLAAAAAPRVLIASSDAASRVLLGAAAARLGAAVVPGVIGLATDGPTLLVRRAAIGGETIETLAADGPVAAIYAGEDVTPPASAPTTVTVVPLTPVQMAVLSSDPIAVASGLADAPRVVSFGRGVRARDDVALIRQLADTLDAEIACSMPVADDLGWLEKERYVGRSGNHISPNLYLAVGIAGAPQHLEGVRGARVVAAINNDPEARIFLSADYGIVGDLYEVVPELIKAVSN